MDLHTETADKGGFIKHGPTHRYSIQIQRGSLNMDIHTDTADTGGFIKHEPTHRYRGIH